MPSIGEMILSESYADIILPSYTGFLTDYKERGAQIFNNYYGMVHYPLEEELFQNYYEYGFFYNTIPKLFTLLDLESLEASGILAVQNQPVLGLKGQDVLIGFIDTGIDYTHPAFRRPDGLSRIVGIWDQTLQTGQPPFDLNYGTAYSQEELNQALGMENPFSLVPSRDENGHGTFLAGVAAGSALPQQSFSGGAHCHGKTKTCQGIFKGDFLCHRVCACLSVHRHYAWHPLFDSSGRCAEKTSCHLYWSWF